MMPAFILTGLQYSAAFLWAGLALHVLFDWSLVPGAKPADMKKLGAWWRATWFMVAIGAIGVSLGYIVRDFGFAYTQENKDMIITFAVATRNLGALMASTGFLLNRGHGMLAIVPVWSIPPVFIALAGASG